MARTVEAVFLALALALWAGLAWGAWEAVVPGEILVQWRGEAQKARALAVAPVLAKARQRRFRHLDIDHIVLPTGTDTQAVLEGLRASGAVHHAEPNWRRRPYQLSPPNETDYLNQWAAAALNLPQVSGGGAPVTIALLDDAFALEHPGLQGVFFVNGGEISGNGGDDDDNGWIDDVQGWDFVDDDPDPSPAMDELCDLGGTRGSHGTMVAGAAALVARNYRDLPIRLLPLRIGCDYGLAAELAAVDYILANREAFHIRVVNMSYGGPAYSVFEQEAVTRLAEAGILVVTAAGNYDVNNDYIPDYPSSMPQPEVLAVAASGDDGRLTPWSQYGALSVDIAAPGTDLVLPTYTRAPFATDPEAGWDGGQDGTSFAAPFTAGVAALLWSLNPDADALAVKGALLAGAAPLVGQSGLLASDGRVDAEAALAALVTGTPTVVIESLDLEGEGLFDPALAVPGAQGRAHLTLRWFGDADETLPAVSLDGQVLTDVQAGLDLGLTVSDSGEPTRQPLSFDFSLGMTRTVPLEVGRLPVDGTVVTGRLRRNDQDDIQRLHLTVPDRPGYDLYIDVEVIAVPRNAVIDLAIARGGYPQLDYYTYCQGGKADGVQTTFTLGNTTRLHVLRPPPGDYQLLLIAPSRNGPCSARHQAERRYRITAHMVPGTPLGGSGSGGGCVWQPLGGARGGGCSLAPGAPGVDPVLPLLLTVALWQVARRRA